MAYLQNPSVRDRNNDWRKRVAEVRRRLDPEEALRGSSVVEPGDNEDNEDGNAPEAEHDGRRDAAIVVADEDVDEDDAVEASGEAGNDVDADESAGCGAVEGGGDQVDSSPEAPPPAREYARLPLAEVDIDDRNFDLREQLDLESLTANVAELKQATPVVVRPRPDGEYQLLSGFRRADVAESLGVGHLDAIIRYDLDDDGDALDFVLAENMNRAEYTDRERLIVASKLEERGLTTKEIGVRMGVSDRMARYYVDISEMDDAVLERLAGEDGLRLSHLIELAKELRRDNDFPLHSWLDRCEKLSVAGLKQALLEARTQESGDEASEATEPSSGTPAVENDETEEDTDEETENGEEETESTAASAVQTAATSNSQPTRTSPASRSLICKGEPDWDNGLYELSGELLDLGNLDDEELEGVVYDSTRLAKEAQKRLDSRRKKAASAA